MRGQDIKGKTVVMWVALVLLGLGMLLYPRSAVPPTADRVPAESPNVKGTQ